MRFAPPSAPAANLVAISHPVYFAREPQDLVDFSRMRLRDYLATHPRWARWHWVPVAGREPLAVPDARRRSPDCLRDDLAERLANGPVRFALDIEVARDADPVDDATAVWEGEREHVPAGTLELTRLAPELDEGDALLSFDPTNAADGISLSADPVLLAGGGAYRMSGAQRLAVRAS